MPTDKPKALVYCRVSTVEQARKDLSIPSQIEDVTRSAEELGYEVAGVYTDPGHSGEAWDRPGLDPLRRRVAEGEIAAMLVRDRDRIGRDGGVLAGLLRREFEPFGTLILAKEAKGDGSTLRASCSTASSTSTPGSNSKKPATSPVGGS